MYENDNDNALQDYYTDEDFKICPSGNKYANEMCIGLQIRKKLTFDVVRIGQFFRIGVDERHDFTDSVLFKLDDFNAVVVADLDKTMLGAVIKFNGNESVNKILKNAKIVWEE